MHSCILATELFLILLTFSPICFASSYSTNFSAVFEIILVFIMSFTYTNIGCAIHTYPSSTSVIISFCSFSIDSFVFYSTIFVFIYYPILFPDSSINLCSCIWCFLQLTSFIPCLSFLIYFFSYYSFLMLHLLRFLLFSICHFLISLLIYLFLDFMFVLIFCRSLIVTIKLCKSAQKQYIFLFVLQRY